MTSIKKQNNNTTLSVDLNKLTDKDKTINQELLQKMAKEMAKEMADKMVAEKVKELSVKNPKSLKPICSAAVSIVNKESVNKELNGKIDVYSITENEDGGKEKTTYFKRCGKHSNNEDDFCWTHTQSKDTTKFNDIISKFDSEENKKKHFVKKLGPTDLLKINASKKGGESSNPNPIMVVNNKKETRDQFKTLNDFYLNVYLKNTGKSLVELNDSASNDNNSDDDAKSDDDDNDAKSDDDDESDDGEDMKTIKDKKGKDWNLHEEDMKLYTNDGELLGNFVEVKDATAGTFNYESKNYICGKELKENGKSYMRCISSKNVFEKNDNNIYAKVGALDKDDKIKFLAKK